MSNMESNTNEPADKLEEAKKLIEEHTKKEIELCVKEVNEVMNKHNCTMIVQGRFVGNQLEYQIVINKNPE